MTKISTVKQDWYNKLLDEFIKNNRKYIDSKSKVFVIVLGKCSPMLQTRIEMDSKFDVLEGSDDVCGLLDLIEEKVFSNSKARHPSVTLIETLKRSFAINQGSQETVGNYYKRFTSQVQVLEKHWGTLKIPELKQQYNNSDDKARDGMLATLFLFGADKARFSGLRDELNTSYLSKVDNYPTTCKDALNLLSQYQDSSRRAVAPGTDSPVEGAAFWQKMHKKYKNYTCDKCGKKGHPTKFCPNKKQTVAFLLTHSFKK